MRQAVAAAGHGAQPLAGGRGDLFQAGGQHEAGQGHLVLVRALAIGEVRQLADLVGALHERGEGGELAREQRPELGEFAGRLVGRGVRGGSSAVLVLRCLGRRRGLDDRGGRIEGDVEVRVDQ